MMILASADVHGERQIYDWLLATARERGVQAIILAGDLFGYLPGFETVEAAHKREAAILARLLDRAGVPVLHIMGNDDLVEMNAGSARVQSIHGRRVQCGGFGFVGYQYSLPFMGGTFEKAEEGIKTDLAPLSALMGPDTIFVSHSPARGILDPGFGEARVGSSSIRDFLENHQFRAHIHGHCHAGFGRVERHFNVAAAGRPRAMIINLETMQHQVLDQSGTRAREA